ncbi:SHOCT domain-containing protein [Rossellomorea aquimaris]|uniref:SHOCT domain-containing protein n=1 Tax=Rossellomorea aquimaris TaxID=189382 RepID=UPI0005CB454F|nr:SHOCT domain-containing protein [Rossellomorea aquimaris]
MSLWKKILGQTDLSPEELAKREKEQAEKKKRKEEEAKRFQEEQDRKREARRIEKERRKAEELKSMERFFGPSPGMGKKITYSAHKEVFQYVERHLLREDEQVLGVIQAEYDKTKKREIKGLLFAAEEKMIFAFVRGNNQYIEEFEYSKMKGISLARDGFASKELFIDYGRGRKKFDDIIDDDTFKSFLSAVNGKIAEYRIKPVQKAKTKPSAKAASSEQGEDKYKQLERIAELKEKGILTEEEFQAEKKKILN